MLKKGGLKMGGLGGSLGGPRKLFKKTVGSSVAEAKKEKPPANEDEGNSEQNTKPNGSDEEEASAPVKSEAAPVKKTEIKAQAKSETKAEEPAAASDAPKRGR